MSEEDFTTIEDPIDLDLSEASDGLPAGQFEDFEQNGLLLKIATDGISVQDYVKRLKESDILVAVDGELFLEGPAELQNRFRMEEGDEPKWLLTFYRDGQLFDILLRAPIQSQFGLATEQETQWALEKFKTHLYGEFSEYQNFEVYRNGSHICDILSLEKDPVAFILPSLWCLKYRLYPPLAALLAAYLTTFFINIILFVITYLILSRFVYISQDNIMRSFTLYAGKNHYMTIAATNENDVSALVKKIDPTNKIRFERNAIRKPTVVHKVIVKGATTPGE